jgi:hypothetical protein
MDPLLDSLSEPLSEPLSLLDRSIVTPRMVRRHCPVDGQPCSLLLSNGQLFLSCHWHAENMQQDCGTVTCAGSRSLYRIVPNRHTRADSY